MSIDKDKVALLEQTRSIYHDQHSRVAADKTAMTRFIGMFSHEYFGLDQTFFSNAKAIDVGCGNTGKLLIGLHRLGCRDITGIDLGEEFIEPTRNTLAQYGISDAKLKSGSVLEIPFADKSFDFVAAHGVLVHLPTVEDIYRGFSELARVTKPGGYLYTVYGCVGGLMEDCIVPALRSYYRSNSEFQKFIDNLSPEHFAHLIDVSEQGIAEHEGQNLNLSLFKNLFDTDLCVFFQNLTQVPVRILCDEEMIAKMYRDNGFAPARRLKRYVKRKNIRQLVAPLHYATDDPLARLIYGSGNLEFIAQKL